MTTLVVGASGATGKQLVEQLLTRGQNVKVIVRSPEKLPDSWKSNNRLFIISVIIIHESKVFVNLFANFLTLLILNTGVGYIFIQ